MKNLRETKEAIAAQDAKATADEMGDLLFAVVNLARKSELDAETVLAAATEKFIGRFHAMERELQDDRGSNSAKSISRGWTKFGIE